MEKTDKLESILWSVALPGNLNGKGPYQIFSEHDFDMTTIGSGKPKKYLEIWRKTYRLFGEGWLAYGL